MPACPFCGAKAKRNDNGEHTGSSPVVAPRACTGSWWWRCQAQGIHLHERCKNCGGTWIVAPLADAEVVSGLAR